MDTVYRTCHILRIHELCEMHVLPYIWPWQPCRIRYDRLRNSTRTYLPTYKPFQHDYMPSIHNAGSYITYAPMTQLSYAFVYLLGAETSKLIPAFIFLFFLITFYGVMKRISGHTCAAVATFLTMITPEMIAFLLYLQPMSFMLSVHH